MPTGYEVEMYRNVAVLTDQSRKQTTALCRIAAALEAAAPEPPLTTIDLAILATALGQHRVHIEEEADATSDEAVAGGLRQRLGIIDTIAAKLDEMGAR